jgi:glycosyltransferase involved in cell wall biosynthesis
VRLAWFTPLPPVTSGVAHYSMDALPAVRAAHAVDVFIATGDELSYARARHLPAHSAHEFVWMHDRAPYDLIVYQLGNAGCHDFMWPYVFQYPGLVVLHDAHLHHARASSLLGRRRQADYAAELAFDRPGVPRDRAAIAAAGFWGVIYYFWPMLRSIVLSARRTAVHNALVAADLRERFESAAVDVIGLGVQDPLAVERGRDAELLRADVRARLGMRPDAFIVLAYGGATPEKRLRAAMRAVAAARDHHPDLRLLIVGASSDSYDLVDEARAAGIADRVVVTGYVTERELTDYLAAADAAVCLRWPTARETSAAWVQCIAAGLPTVVSDLAHLAHLPTIEPLGWAVRHIETDGRPVAPIAITVDLLDEEHLLARALRRLISDAPLRASLGAAARAYFERHHTIAQMGADYLRVIDAAAAAPPPRAELPAHLRPDP